jgi:hypothetical protein
MTDSTVRRRKPAPAADPPKEKEQTTKPLPLNPVHYVFLGFTLLSALICFMASFATGDYIFYILPGLAEVIAAAFAYVNPGLGMPASIMVEALGIGTLLRSRNRRPLVLKLAVHFVYWCSFFALAISGAKRMVENETSESEKSE